MKPNFTIRVYGLIVEDNRVVLSGEKYGENEMVKFPGGELEFGEGTVDCLKREMKEEFNLDVEIVSHFFTTDFFVASAFHPDTQVMSIYYFIKVLNHPIPVNRLFEDSQGQQTLFWAELNEIQPNQLTFPIDQKVVKLLKDKYLN